ncbi:MAG: YjbF family lipoprotein [Paracoccaceae bacterium]
MRRLIPLLLVLALASCSSADRNTEAQGVVLVRVVKEQIAARRSKGAAKPNSAVLLTRAQLNGVTDSLIRVRVEKTGQFSLLYIAQRNGLSQVWFSPDKASTTLRAGLIVQSRGLGYDVYSVNAPQMVAVLERRGQTGPATRTHRTLDGNNAIIATQYTCTIANVGNESLVVLDRTYSATHYREDCSGESDSFTNDYWLDASGVTRVSRQRISAEFGYIFTERLID